MLLSIVVTLLSTVNGTQSAQQAASPLIPSWRRDPALMIPVSSKRKHLRSFSSRNHFKSYGRGAVNDE